MKQTVVINEIGPRDGFQNVDRYIDLQTKLRIIDGIVEAGIQRIQVTSFVNPKAVPQMKDAAEVARTCLERYPNIACYALVPNMQGAQTAAEIGLKEISYVASVSESHNLSNVRKTVDQSMEELEAIIQKYPDMKLNLDVATAFGCPVEGITSYDKLCGYFRKAWDAGARSFTICDSNGIADPVQVETYLTDLQRDFPGANLRVHIHDTRNMGMVNSLTAVKCGIRHVETAIGGLGGCPFLKGASGNTATEDFVYMLQRMGYETEIDMNKLMETAMFAAGVIEGNFSGHHIKLNDNCKHQRTA